MAMQTSALITSDDGGGGGSGSNGKKYTKNRKYRDKSDLGEDFTAPDGGWAWMVCIAAGLSNLSIYPCLQQFGFLFRVRMIDHAMMTSSQVTSIINTNSAISACTGLLNGPMFRRFSFRQVALAGSLLIFMGLLFTAFCESFISYIVAYSLLYGFGAGISVSASSLAINTYFKNRRRHASGFSWTITGLGPIFLPHVVTFLLTVYGVGGTVMIFAAFALHSFVCGLIYQPVHYHAPPRKQSHFPPLEQSTTVIEQHHCLQCDVCEGQMQRDGILSGQYMYQDDDEEMRGFEIMEPGTPMLSRANDGWFGSKMSLSSARTRFRTISSCKDIEKMNRLTSSISEDHQQMDNFFKPNNFARERDEVLKRRSNSNINLDASPPQSKPHMRLHCTCSKQNLSSGIEKEEELIADSTERKRMSLLQKVVAFFDLDLLRDLTFVNLVAGLTIINFGELNFSILTPFILNDFGFDTNQITLAMSLLATLDILMRFLVPFITEKIPWDNRVFFLIGVVGIAVGRTFVAITRSYTTILICFTWIGICKGIRTIFWPLIIPSYVPLKRLPAASGLQLLISGLFTLAAGPFVGLVRDRFSYSVALHCLDCMTFLAAFCWTLEALVRYRQRKNSKFKSNANLTNA